MGLEADCTLTRGRARHAGRAHLDSDHVRFKAEDGSFSAKIMFDEIDVTSLKVERGVLHIPHGRSRTKLELGRAAETWYTKIRYPRTLLDKLGVKPGMRVSVIGVSDDRFISKLEDRTDDIGRGRTRKNSDFIFFGVEDVKRLDRLATLRASIKPAGAIWVIWSKGRDRLKQSHVMAAAKRAGLVDVKIVSFSDTHSGLKLMIPKDQR